MVRKPPCRPSLLSSNDYQVYFLTQLFFQRKSDYIYISLHPLPMVTCLSSWYIRCPVSLEQITSWEEKQEPPTFIKEPGQNTRKKTTDQTTQGYGCREAAPLPALLDRLQHQLRRPRQLLPHHPAHQEKPVHFLWHTSCPFPYWRCEYLGKNYFILSTRNTRLV